MKRFLLLLLLPCLLAGLCSCSLTSAEYYQHAQLYLGSGDPAGAAELFSCLGEYEDSADYALYCAALDALQNGQLTLARANLMQVHPFKSSSRYLDLIDAMLLEEEGDLDGALARYDALGTFERSHEHAARLRELIPQRDLSRARALMAAHRWEQAMPLLEELGDHGDAPLLLSQCRDGIARAAYDEAAGMYDRGAYQEALAAFEALGDTLDAAVRADQCRSAIYQQLEEAFPTADMHTAAELMARYGELGDFRDAPARLAGLSARFSVNLELVAHAGDAPCLRFGSYPVGESGAEAPLLWRIVSVDGSRATLLCTHVIDAMDAASAAALQLTLTPQEQAGFVSLALPRAGQLVPGPAQATAYAMAQGVRHHANGCAWWWLADEAAPGRNCIVWYTGSVLPTGVDAAESCVGVRPMITIDLNAFAFTSGTGSMEDPYQ